MDSPVSPTKSSLYPTNRYKYLSNDIKDTRKLTRGKSLLKSSLKKGSDSFRLSKASEAEIQLKRHQTRRLNQQKLKSPVNKHIVKYSTSFGEGIWKGKNVEWVATYDEDKLDMKYPSLKLDTTTYERKQPQSVKSFVSDLISQSKALMKNHDSSETIAIDNNPATAKINLSNVVNTHLLKKHTSPLVNQSTEVVLNPELLSTVKPYYLPKWQVKISDVNDKNNDTMKSQTDSNTIVSKLDAISTDTDTRREISSASSSIRRLDSAMSTVSFHASRLKIDVDALVDESPISNLLFKNNLLQLTPKNIDSPKKTPKEQNISPLNRMHSFGEWAELLSPQQFNSSNSLSGQFILDNSSNSVIIHVLFSV